MRLPAARQLPALSRLPVEPQRWPITVTFAFYYDHPPVDLELISLGDWIGQAYGMVGEALPTVDGVEHTYVQQPPTRHSADDPAQHRDEMC